VHLVELDRDECVRLLASSTLGRIAVNAPGWPPVIRPVTYAFDQRSQSVVFGSAEGSKLTTLLRSERAAFEIDGIDADGRGWSVIVVGPVEEITSAAERARLRGSAHRHLMRLRATVDFGHCIQIAKAAGFQGVYSIEAVDRGDAYEAVQRVADAVRRFL